MTNINTFYEVRSPNDSYYMTITKHYDYYNALERIVLNVDKCISMSISPFSVNKFMLLEGVYKLDSCNKNKDFLTKYKGSRDMIHTSLAFFNKICLENGVEPLGVILKDSSYVPESGDISLYYLYISLHGLTWNAKGTFGEKYFGAELDTRDEDKKKTYGGCLLKMIDTENKKSVDFLKFQEIIGRPLNNPLCEEIYNTSPTYMDFFNRVLKEIFNDNLTNYSLFIKPWIANFMRKQIFNTRYEFGSDTMYVIRIDKLEYHDGAQISSTIIDLIPSSGGSVGKRIKVYDYYDKRRRYDIIDF
jgi:hypothetical protein